MKLVSEKIRDDEIELTGEMCFRFLDALSYLAGKCSYDAFLSAFGLAGEKGFFPYEVGFQARSCVDTSLVSMCVL